MKYLLDTNFCIEILRGKSELAKIRLQSAPSSELVMCPVVEAELLLGVALSQNPSQARAKLLPFWELTTLAFDRNCAQHYAEIRADLQQRGALIGPNDLMIAAIACANSLILVTHNTREFSRVLGLQVEDWQE